MIMIIVAVLPEAHRPVLTGKLPALTAIVRTSMLVKS